MREDVISRKAALHELHIWEMNTTYEMGFCEDDLSPSDVINALPAAMRWIPCSERLPEYGKEVLLYVRDNLHEREWQGVGSLGRDIRYRKQKAWNFVTLPRRYAGEQITGQMQYDVLAWMPLPEPYKEGDPEDGANDL